MVLDELSIDHEDVETGDGYAIRSLRGLFDADLYQQWLALYEDSFHDPATRENPRHWRNWLQTDEAVRCTDSAGGESHVDLPLNILLYVDERQDTPRVIGGLNIEYYERSGCALITYIAVEKSSRKQGIARQLVDSAVQWVRDFVAFRQSGGKQVQFQGVLFETYRPHWKQQHDSVESQTVRLRALSRMGGRMILFGGDGYVQPPLEPGNAPSHDLMLCYIPSPFTTRQDITYGTVVRFIAELSEALTGRTDTEHLPRPLVQASPASGAAMEPLPVRFRQIPQIEQPTLALEHVGFALHFQQRVSTGQRSAATEQADGQFSCPGYKTWEHDLLAHAYHDRKPFWSRCFHPIRAVRLRVTFPAVVHFSSEGRDMEIHTCDGLARTRCFDLRISQTRFRESRNTIWHVCLRSTGKQALTEYDLIKLNELYEGYENCLDQCPIPDYQFELLDAQDNPLTQVPFDISQLMRHLLADIRPELGEAPYGELKRALDADDSTLRFPDGGTLQILTGGCREGLLWDELLELVRNARPTASDAAARKQLEDRLARSPEELGILRATCGIVQGIFDFEEIDISEMLDILDPTLPEVDGLIRMHRKTLTGIYDHDRAFVECKASIGISPYLILPHAVLLHNQMIVSEASIYLDAADNLLQRTSGERDPYQRIFRKIRNRSIWSSDKSSLLGKDLHQLEEYKRKAATCLDALHLPNPFNYHTEREMVARSAETHSINARLQSEKSRLERLERDIEFLRERLKHKHMLFVEVIIIIITIFSAGDFLHGLSDTYLPAYADMLKYVIPLLIVGLAVAVAIQQGMRFNAEWDENDDASASG